MCPTYQPPGKPININPYLSSVYNNKSIISLFFVEGLSFLLDTCCFFNAILSPSSPFFQSAFITFLPFFSLFRCVGILTLIPTPSFLPSKMDTRYQFVLYCVLASSTKNLILSPQFHSFEFFFVQFAYEANTVQMKFLRILSASAKQEVTHDCIQDIHLLGTNNKEMPNEHTRCKVNQCHVMLTLPPICFATILFKAM